MISNWTTTKKNYLLLASGDDIISTMQEPYDISHMMCTHMIGGQENKGEGGGGRGRGHMGNTQNIFEMMKTCQQKKQMNKNVKDKMREKEHKQPRETQKSINRGFFWIHRKKHVAECMKQLQTFSFGLCKHVKSINKCTDSCLDVDLKCNQNCASRIASCIQRISFSSDRFSFIRMFHTATLMPNLNLNDGQLWCHGCP